MLFPPELGAFSPELDAFSPDLGNFSLDLIEVSYDKYIFGGCFEPFSAFYPKKYLFTMDIETMCWLVRKYF